MPGDPVQEMSCRELVELITAYVEGDLPEHERIRFEEHLEICEGCVTYLDQMRQTIGTLGELNEDSIDPMARDELLEAFRGWRGAG